MMSAEEVLQETAQLAGFDPLDLRDENGVLKDLADMDAGTRKSIQEISMTGDGIVSVKIGRDKRPALDMLLKTYNKYDDHQNAGNGEIKVMMYCAQDANL